MQSEYSKNVVLVQTEGSLSFITTNCGRTFKAMFTREPVVKYLFNPSKDKLLVGLFDVSIAGGKVSKELKLSTDLGETWTSIAKDVYSAAWAYSPSLHGAKSPIPHERLLVVKGNPAKPDSGYSLLYSDDYFKTSKLLLDGGNRFAITQFYLYAARVESEKTKEIGLYVSPTIGYNFKKVKLPFSLLTEHSYTIAEQRTRHIFLHVSHSTGLINYGDLYVSDSTGSKFEISLRNNVRSENGFCDFTRVQGIDGVYIANVYESKNLAFVHAAIEHTKSEKQQREILSKSLERRSFITYDRGFSWKPLTISDRIVQAKTAHGVIIGNIENASQEETKSHCPGSSIDCRLHLHSLSSPEHVAIAASANSPGVLLANGNSGPVLQGQEDTYFSRDAGVTWELISKGGSVYDIGDQGGLILQGSESATRGEVSFSWDLGYHWKKIMITPENQTVFIKDIRADPAKLGVKFIVHGVARNGTDYGFVSIVDFSGLLSTPCATEDDLDYEEWVPEFPGGQCHFGKRIAYKRRKPYVLCYNADDLELTRVKNYCFCTQVDWECTESHYRVEDGKCVPFDPKSVDRSPPEDCDAYYLIPTGYKKVPETECERGLDLSGEVYPCPRRRNLK